MTAIGKDFEHPKANGINGHAVNGEKISASKERNAWEAPGPAAFDFRSTFPYTKLFLHLQ